MKALRVNKAEKETVAELVDMPIGDLTGGDVLIRTECSSINYKDALAVTGKGKIMRQFPLNAGIDAAGVVESSDDAQFACGDAVLVTGYGLGEYRDGGFADYVRVPADCVVPMPSGMSARQAMGLGTAGFTAGFALQRLEENHQHPELGPVVVTGATGGVGSFAVNMLANLGYEVVAVSRKAQQADQYLQQLGAARVITPEAIDNQGRPLESARWGAVVDNVGGELLAQLIRQVHPYGNVASIGLAGGVGLEMTVLPFILRGVSVLGIHSVECPMPRRRRIWADLSGRLQPAVEKIARQSVALTDVQRICESMVAGETLGRTIVETTKE